jgi:hypothetical protein
MPTRFDVDDAEALQPAVSDALDVLDHETSRLEDCAFELDIPEAPDLQDGEEPTVLQKQQSKRRRQAVAEAAGVPGRLQATADELRRLANRLDEAAAQTRSGSGSGTSGLTDALQAVRRLEEADATPPDVRRLVRAAREALETAEGVADVSR